jgi:hypothetical protein
MAVATGYRYDIEDRPWLLARGVPFDGRVLGAPALRSARPINYRGVLPIEQQGALNSCPGHADQSAQEVLQHRETGDVVRPSRMLAYLLAQEFSGTLGLDRGATIAGALKGAEAGNCLEEEFPYPDQYSIDIPQGVFQKAKKHPTRSHAVLRTYDEVLAWLRGFGPVLGGIEWWESYAFNRSGGLTAQDYGVMRRGGRPPGHAVCFAGESDSLGPDGRPDLEVKNSHGEDWGDRGWAKVSAQLVDRMLASRFTCLIGVARFTPFECKQHVDAFMAGGVYG